MNISKFTQKSMEAVERCQKLAYEYGNQDIGADGESDEYVYQQVDEGACASYGGQSLMAGKPAHNNNIGRVE